MASNDISFCGNTRCERIDCRRHMRNVPKEGLYSMSQFSEGNGSSCSWYWEVDRK